MSLCFKVLTPDISISGAFFKNYFSPVIQCSIDFHKNLIKKIKKYFIFIW